MRAVNGYGWRVLEQRYGRSANAVEKDWHWLHLLISLQVGTPPLLNSRQWIDSKTSLESLKEELG